MYLCKHESTDMEDRAFSTQRPSLLAAIFVQGPAVHEQERDVVSKLHPHATIKGEHLPVERLCIVGVKHNRRDAFQAQMSPLVIKINKRCWSASRLDPNATAAFDGCRLMGRTVPLPPETILFELNHASGELGYKVLANTASRMKEDLVALRVVGFPL